MADGNVVSLSGNPVIAPGTPRPDLIAELEKLLGMAQAGEIDGIAYVAVYRDDATGSDQFGRLTRSMIGSMSVLNYTLCKHVSETQ